LAAAGFQRGQANNADRSDHEQTEVRYRPGKRDAAQLVAAYLVAGGALVEDDEIDHDVVVLIGRDFTGVEAPDRPGTSTSSNGSSGAPTATSEAPPNPGSSPGVTVPPSEVGRPLVGCG
jgi:hypothetical protein